MSIFFFFNTFTKETWAASVQDSSWSPWHKKSFLQTVATEQPSHSVLCKSPEGSWQSAWRGDLAAERRFRAGEPLRWQHFSLRVQVFTVPWATLKDSFPHSSVGKEPACNAGDPSSIPGSGSSAGEGIGYPRQYSWTSLVAQLVKNPHTVRETWIQSLGWEDLLEKERLPTPVFWPGESHGQSMGLQRVGHDWATFTEQHQLWIGRLLQEA